MANGEGDTNARGRYDAHVKPNPISLATTLLLMVVAATTAPTSAPSRTADSAITPVPRIPKAHQAILAKIAQGGAINLIMLGDSITDYWPRRGPDSWKHLQDMGAIDEGVSGDCTEHVLWRITHGELDNIHPKALVLLIGINNLWHHVEERPEWTAAGVEKIIQTIHDKLPDTKVLVLAVFPVGPKVPDRDRVAALNGLISKLDDGDKTRYLDIGKNFLDDRGEVSLALMPDGVHPNAKGYQVWLDAMSPTLQELMK